MSAQPQLHSKSGRISFFIALLTLPTLAYCFFVGYRAFRQFAGSVSDSPETLEAATKFYQISAIVSFDLFLMLLGIITGLYAIFQKQRKRTFGYWGLGLQTLPLVGLFLVSVIS